MLQKIFMLKYHFILKATLFIGTDTIHHSFNLFYLYFNFFFNFTDNMHVTSITSFKGNIIKQSYFYKK